jgi:DNA mismatch repair protein MutS2
MSVLKLCPSSNEIGTTSFGSIRGCLPFLIRNEGVENASVEFDVETLRPTYRLLVGTPGKSNAFEISKRLGLPEFLIADARKYLSQENVHFEDIMGDIERNRVASEKERQLTQTLLAEAEALKLKHESELANLNEQRAKLISNAKEEARKLVRDAKLEMDEIIKELNQLKLETADKERNQGVEASRKKLRDTLGRLEGGVRLKSTHGGRRIIKDLQLGQSVYVTTLDQKGQVLSVPDQDGNVMVQVGIMKVNVKLSDLRQTNEVAKSEQKSGKKVKPRVASVSSELDLRGQNSEEALVETDRYLDNAFLAGLQVVTIIHGKGTGVLRTAIHQLLRSHPHVGSFRLGKYGEGESGVTVVELR